MMKLRKYIALAVLCALLLSLTGCGAIGTRSSISVDENGVVTWSAVNGAEAYECNLVTGDYVCVRTVVLKETTFTIPEGYSLHVRAVLGDGQYGNWMTSDYFGEPVLFEDIPEQEEVIVDAGVDPNAQITMDENGVVSWAAVEGAQAYECQVVNGNNAYISSVEQKETTFALPEGYCLHVRPIFGDGQYGSWMTSDYYGEPVLIVDTGTEDILQVSVDEDGNATWPAYEGAVRYECDIAATSGMHVAHLTLTENQFRLPSGFSISVCAVTETGEEIWYPASEYYISEEYGDLSLSFPVTMDENGVVSWDPIPGVAQYEYAFLGGNFQAVETGYTDSCSLQLPMGLCAQVRIVFDGGFAGEWQKTEFYGSPMTEKWYLTRILVDENGVASWDPVPGARYYEYSYMDAEFIGSGDTFRTKDTFVEVPEGFCISMYPCLANGEYGDSRISEFRGTPILWADVPERKYPDWPVRVDGDYEVEYDDLLEYELISNIRLDTVVTHPDGSVTFEADGPDGSVLRFWGTDVAVAEGSVTVGPAGELMGLDSIGRICAMKLDLSDGGSPENAFSLLGGFTFTDDVSVESVDELFWANKGLARETS